jgi:DNA-binding LacI/PurR family transcriptional regulator
MIDPAQYTISDVAQKAGVSVSTVSRVLNGKQDVASETRERILRIIEELGYTPQAQAQRLRAGMAHNIALLFPIKYPANTLFNPLDMDFIVGGAAAAGEHEFFFSLLTTSINKRTIIDLYRSTQVDGLVLMQIHFDDWRVNLLRDSNYPFVMIGRCADNTGLSYIDVDFEASVQMAFEHLISLGHREIAFLGHSQDLHESGYGPAQRSWQGYQSVLEAHNLNAFYREVSFVGKEIFNATLRLFDDHPTLTGIVTTHAHAVPHIQQALNTLGRRVPEDCSIVALTSSRIADMNIPTLTHVEFPSHEMGYRAVDILIRTLSGQLQRPEQILIPPQLVIRHSTRSL